jgi:hypothetical protein
MTPQKQSIGRRMGAALVKPMTVKLGPVELSGPGIVVLSIVILFLGMLSTALFLVVRHPEIIDKILGAL